MSTPDASSTRHVTLAWTLFFVLSALSMTVGNLVALRQTNVVRMLAARLRDTTDKVTFLAVTGKFG